ncbi:MAG: helix-turn-helix transcriptional regulator [Clostridia bacterium]|nr:helix-turn-helix transcriptional regulator [Clostridia bacterium]
MTLSIGQTIKKLRKERNLTQEELAEQLNVTSQAISKWENDTGMPDISQVLPLASVFGVSTDILFGTAGMNDAEEVEKIIDELHQKNKNLEIDDYEEYKHLIEALKRYPNNYTLLYNCMVKGSFLLRTEWREKLSKEEKKCVYDECIRQSNVILQYCPRTDIVINTKRELTALLTIGGERGKVRALIDELPSSIADISSIVLAKFLLGCKDWDGAIKTCHNNIYELINEMRVQAKFLASAYMRSGQYEKAEIVCLTMLDVIKAIFKDETYTPPFHIALTFYRFLAICSLRRRNDEEEAVGYLEQMYEYTMCQVEGFQKVKHVKTPMLETYEMDFNYPHYEPKQMLLTQIEKGVFEPLHKNDRFIKLMEKINALEE